MQLVFEETDKGLFIYICVRETKTGKNSKN